MLNLYPVWSLPYTCNHAKFQINMPQYTYVEHSKLSCSMVWCTARLLQQIHHQISLSHYKIAMSDAFIAFFKLWREEVKIIEKRYQISLVRQGHYCKISVIAMCNLLNNECCWIKGLVIANTVHKNAIIKSDRECQQHMYQKCGKHSGGCTGKELGNLQFPLISHACVLPLALVGWHIYCVLI